MKESLSRFPIIAYKIYKRNLCWVPWEDAWRQVAPISAMYREAWIVWLPPNTVGITQDTLVSIRI